MTRTVIHILLGLVLWVVFCFYWHLVMQQPITGETKRALVIVATMVAGITLFDWAWIFHNLRIYKRTRRRERRAMPRFPIVDYLGRKFTEEDEMLHRARYIEVSIIEMADARESEGRKLFRVSDIVPEE
ncbi:MAG TPA: hypothetical protein VFH33_02785 [Candidatus Krumholzibacteria bacterium]|nr:hypothetical protein [Candidatus Krumholzibacteria bacterium]